MVRIHTLILGDLTRKHHEKKGGERMGDGGSLRRSAAVCVDERRASAAKTPKYKR